MPVPVHVAGARHVAAEAVALVLRRERQEDAAILAGIDIGLPRVRRARDDVRDAVAVDIARALDAQAEAVAGSSVGGPEELPGLARIGVHAAGPGSADVLRRCRRDHVVDTISIHVADGPRDPAEL